MSNVVRNGFSTLNRLLGKKNKNGGLSKSSTNLNRSTTNLDATSQQHNQITPLTVSANAPFEQTFRVTICLPLDQLYVARVGAKTKLSNVLHMVCTNKLLDPNKFEFRHPIDGSQVFELDLTIGEVGLNEIRLAPKGSHATAPEDVKFRTHSIHSVTQSDCRFDAINHNSQRPHTISASPYSSTNSLNSTDSSGPISSFRTSNMPSVPCRKKRIAPRPPSQNSIPEDKEQICEKRNGSVDHTAADDAHIFKQPQLIRHNFHVSSPNLMPSNLMRCTKTDTNISVDTSLSSASDQMTINSPSDGNSLGRSLSMQSHDEESNGMHAYSRTHSRTSSDASDNIGRDGHSWPEPIPRKRILIGKKKAAPSPPPRVSSINHAPVATPRNILQKLTEEQSKEIEEVVESNSEEIIPSAPAKSQLAFPDTESKSSSELVSSTPEKELPVASSKSNVTKVMLNVVADVETSNSHDAIANESPEHIFSHKIVQSTDSSPLANGTRNISCTQINGIDVPKKRSISVVELNVDHLDVTAIEDRLTESDHAALSKEVNEIIDKAIEMNEARLTAPLNDDVEDDVNNNKNNNANSESPLWIYTLPAPPTFADGKLAITPSMSGGEKCPEIDSGVCAASPKDSLSSDDDMKCMPSPVERPIEPIICEKSPIDFHHDTNDSSLPTSNSTYGTASTEPESLRTSDIEDGYKGNSGARTSQVNGEQFVENEFEFLSNELCDDASSTCTSTSPSPTNEVVADDEMVRTELPKTFNYNGTNSMNGKANVIDELTTIISANRLDSVIKPNDANDAIDGATAASKRSTLSNFHIGAYAGNGNHENVCHKSAAPITAVETVPIRQQQPQQPHQPHKRLSLVENPLENCNENGILHSTPKRLTNGPGAKVSTTNDTSDNVKIPKYVSRSKSFHSTLSWSAVRNANPGHPECADQVSPLNGLSDATRQRSSSELSIADSPSLQSVEVLRSIMNNSRKNSLNESMTLNKPNVAAVTAATTVVQDDVINKIPMRNDVNGNGKVTQIGTKKTWKYEGPPSINVSTWGERPKSQVFIKSDNDYKFGGMSKMAALQKRFSAHLTDAGDGNANNKKPVVCAVEYKRTQSLADRNGNQSQSMDTIDSEVDIRPTRRPSYEISRIVSDKPTNNYSTMTLGRVSTTAKHDNASTVKRDFSQNRVTNANGNASFVQRVVSFNGNGVHAPVVKGFKAVDIVNSNGVQKNESRFHQSLPQPQQQQQQQQSLVKLSTYEPPPPFSQFTLRKTGLKEKILDESNNNQKSTNATVNGNRVPIEETANKRHTTILTAAPKPPPPPISQKPTIATHSTRAPNMNRSQSMPVEPRNQLLDSIRNFNRTALKKR